MVTSMGYIFDDGERKESSNRLKAHCKTVSAFLLLALLGLMGGCAAPQRFWPQEDMVGSETSEPDGGQVVLIASRSSDFKTMLVAKLHERLAAEGLPQKTIGVKGLCQVDAADYRAVVVISTCLAWGLDHDVQIFLDRQKTGENIILLTTSGDGAWLPDKDDNDYDALSAASKMTSVEAVVREIMERIHSRMPKTHTGAENTHSWDINAVEKNG